MERSYRIGVRIIKQADDLVRFEISVDVERWIVQEPDNLRPSAQLFALFQIQIIVELGGWLVDQEEKVGIILPEIFTELILETS